MAHSPQSPDHHAPTEPCSDLNLPENSPENLDRKLDHAVEETFPTSDPVSVTVTKGGAIDYDRQDDPGDQTTAESPPGRAQDALRGAADSAAGTVRQVYSRARRTLSQAGERDPNLERSVGRGARSEGQEVQANRMLALVVAGAVGYALAWTIYRGQSGRRTPDRASTMRDAPGRRTGKPLIESDRVQGTAVYDPGGHQIGTIKRLMLDKISGRVAYAVMSCGGFLGIGAEEFAVPWSKLDYDTCLEGYRTTITEEQLRYAPRLNGPGDLGWSDRRREQDLHDYYGVSYYWIAL